MSLSNIRARDLAASIAEVAERTPDAFLIKNQVGNLSISTDGEDYIGWVDLRNGEVTYFEDEDGG